MAATSPSVSSALGDASGRSSRAIRRTSSTAVANVADLAFQIGRGSPEDTVEVQAERGERLADLVVQLGGHAAAFCLSLAECAHARLAALGLQPVEHLVERVGQDGELRLGARTRQALAGAQRIDRAHESREAHERRRRAADEHDVGGHHDREAAGERRDAPVGGLDDEDEARHAQHRGVGHQQSPEQRDVAVSHR